MEMLISKLSIAVVKASQYSMMGSGEEVSPGRANSLLKCLSFSWKTGKK